MCELYGGVMATIQQETIKLNKVSLGSNLVVFYFTPSIHLSKAHLHLTQTPRKRNKTSPIINLRKSM
jgi:hypothetical protein